MDVSYLPALVGYLSRHSEVSQSLTVGVAAAVAVVVAILLRTMLRTMQPRTVEATPSVAALDVVLWPLCVIIVITIIERFRLLA